MNTNLREEQTWLAVASLIVLAMVALAFCLSYTQGVMVPFVLAVFIAMIVSPVVDYQVVRFKVPHPIAVAVALLLVLAIMVILGLVLIMAFQTVADTAGAYSDSFAGLMKDAFDRIENTFDRVEAWEIGLDREKMHEALLAFSERVQGTIPSVVKQTVLTSTGLLTNGFLIVIFVVFILAGRNPRQQLTGVYAEIESSVRTYITAKFAISAVTGILVWLVLSAFGLPMASLFGLLAFLLNFIPSVGSIIATLLPLPVAVAHFDSAWWILIVVGTPGIIQLAIGNVIEPKLMGKELKLHPVTILLVLAFWGLLWGAIGMVLAVPMTATIRIVLMRFETTRPIGNLLAGELPAAGKPVASAETSSASSTSG